MKSLEEKIKKLNLKSNIKICLKKLKDKKRIWLRMNKNNKDSYLFLDLFITNDDKKNDIALKIADEIRTQKEIEINLKRLDYIPKDKYKENEQNESQSIDFKTFYLDQIQHKKQKNKSHYLNALNQFTKWLKKDIDLTQITPRLIEDYSRTLTHLSTHTQMDYIRALKIIFNRAIENELITQNPVKIKIHLEEPDTVFLTEDEIQKVINVNDRINLQVKYAFIFSCLTGLRKSDIYNLTWDKVQNNQLSTRQQKTKNMVRMKLPESAVKILNNQDKNSQKVFDLPNDKNLRLNLKKLIKKADITKNVNFHSARHTFGCLCAAQGMDILMIKELMGHTDIKTTMRYVKLVSKKRDEAIDKLPKFNI